MASTFYDEEDPTKPAGAGAAAQPATPPTFAQLQAKGMPRPPSPALNALYGAQSGGMGYGGAASIPRPPGAYGGPAPQAPPPATYGGPAQVRPPVGGPSAPSMPPSVSGGASPAALNTLLGGGNYNLPRPGGPPMPPGLNVPGGGAGPGAPDAHANLPGAAGGATPYSPTGQLDQSNLEGYLYDMLANPTATPTYQNSMRQIGSSIDTNAAKRGVFYSTLPVGAYSNAGANLASGLQSQAYDQLHSYNTNYEALLKALLGST